MEKENWAMKSERLADERWEKELNSNLEINLNKLEEIKSTEYLDSRQLKKVLTQIVEIYETMRSELFEYDVEDYRKRKVELENLKYKMLQEEHESMPESKSWQDYKKEEERDER